MCIRDRIYTDLGILTADDAICDDVQDLFNVMTGCGIIDEYRKLFVSPKGTRPNIVRLIEEEVALHKKHGGGHKMCIRDSLKEVSSSITPV